MFGKLLANTLKKSGIFAEGVVTDSSVFTTLAFVALDGAGKILYQKLKNPV